MGFSRCSADRLGDPEALTRFEPEKRGDHVGLNLAKMQALVAAADMRTLDRALWQYSAETQH
jgi:hypothetical protein